MSNKYDAIRDIILRNIPDSGNYPSSIKGVQLVRRDNPTDFAKCFYEPCCIFVLQGKKQIIYGENNLIYKRGNFVISCADIPASCRVMEATANEPFVILVLEIDSNIISDLILETKLSQSVNEEDKSLAIADCDESLLDAFYRLAQLIEKPQDEILSSILIKEIYYRLLTGPLGNQLRLINTKGTNSNQIAQAIRYLKKNFNEKLSIDDIAGKVNMASSSFYRNFKKVTQVSPLQYQKQLRLYEAQRLMISDNHNAETASYIVGYESPTQFSREYKKMFGNPPKTDIKKLVYKFIIIFFIIVGFFNNTAFAEDGAKIRKEIFNSITEIYGKNNAEEIYNKVMVQADSAISSRSKELIEQDKTRTSDWYKDEIIYMFYVDQFGTVQQDKENTFKDTAMMLDYLKDLGVTTLYMLPFAESPMNDAGFDVKNPKNVRKELGGLEEFNTFIKAAKKEGFKIKADLVLNHLSQEHEWFKKIEAGDESALEYFVYTDTMPEYKKYQDEKLGTVVEYTEKDGSISKRRLIFPESVENNYRKVEVNGKDYYIYHTFYPFQLDINWNNPEVLYYELETISHWANLGIDIFRMDAIPYLSKQAGTNAENLPQTHAIVRLLSDYIQLTAPSSVIQVEACQPPKDLIQYFGKERDVEIYIDEEIKKLKRTNEAQIAYNFPYMPAIWASLVTEDKKYFIDAYKKTPEIPKTAAWGIFLRVHDELTLEMVSPEVREILFNDLVKKGENFRNGFGVSGRLANFLDKNPNRIETAFSILLSLPGIPIIYYGDEVGVANNYENAKQSALKRNLHNLISAFDSRDINRGIVPAKVFYGSTKGYYEFNSRVYEKVKNLIALRKQLPVMANGDFEILKTKSKSNFAYIRKNKDSQILVINNLSKEKLIAEVTLPTNIILKNEGHITSLKNLINNDNIRVNISLQSKTMHLRVAPYQVLWLEL